MTTGSDDGWKLSTPLTTGMVPCSLDPPAKIMQERAAAKGATAESITKVLSQWTEPGGRSVADPTARGPMIGEAIKQMDLPLAHALLDALRGMKLTKDDAVMVRMFAEALDSRCHPAVTL